MNEITERAKKLVVRNHWIQIGRRRERERIIRMLEKLNNQGWVVESTQSIIELIKGETNGNSH